MPRFCVFRSRSVFVLCGARGCEQSLGNARTPQGRSACLSISLVECRKLCHSGIFRPELWHELWHELWQAKSAGSWLQAFVLFMPSLEKDQSMKRRKQILGHSRSGYLINSNHIYAYLVERKTLNAGLKPSHVKMCQAFTETSLFCTSLGSISTSSCTRRTWSNAPTILNACASVTCNGRISFAGRAAQPLSNTS